MRLACMIFVLFAVSCINVKEYGESLLRQELEDKYLKAHNQIRDMANVKPIVWDNLLALTAQEQANELAKECRSDVLPIDVENIFQSWGSMLSTPKEVVHKWASGNHYQLQRIVSRSTVAVGCGFAICKDPNSYSTSVIHICNYRKKSILDRLES